MTNDFLEKADWDSLIASLSDSELPAEDYLNRAYARCFQASKDHSEGNYGDAVEDASKAFTASAGNKALCVRAYAYYLGSNYERAIQDCEEVIHNAEERPKDTVFAHELLGKIYANMGRHLEASRHYKTALLFRQGDPLDIVSASPLLMDAYREVCKRVKGN